AGGHDGVIALGGGSALDAGKAIALIAAQSCDLFDLEDVGDNWRRADAGHIHPTIAVPTTAGTGSEVGRAAVITDQAAARKRIIFHPRMTPPAVIADPALTTGLPPALTAATGMDALAHNLEAFCAPGFHPMARGIAVEAIAMLKTWLPRAVADGADLTARSHMLAASTMGATAFQRGLGAMHALAHPLGAIYDAHHGLLNAVLMPYVLTANRPAIDGDLDYLARCLDLGDGDGVVAWIRDLRAEIGIPDGLRDIGIDDDAAERVGALAVADPSAATNPRALTAADYADLFRRAVNGQH
ncbi:MAG: iron-containing alcohol dehydrogenase, partial [Thalassobaculaceae bacterium]